MENEQSASNEIGNVPNFKYFEVRHVLGLLVAMDQESQRGQISVVRGDQDGQFYPVWDSTWDSNHMTPLLPTDVALLSIQGHRGVLAVPTIMNRILEVHHTLPEGRQTTIYIHPSSENRNISCYMKSLASEDVTQEQLAKPIPRDEFIAFPGSREILEEGGGSAEGYANSLEVATSDSEIKKSGVQDEFNAAAEVSGAAAGGFGDIPYLHAREHVSGSVTLNVDSRRRQLRLRRSKQGTDALIFNLKKEGGTSVQYYRFKRGYTLRFVHCGKTTEKLLKNNNGVPERRTLDWKECHVHFPDDRWHTGFHHEPSPEDYGTGYGKLTEEQARHNALAFPRFMEEMYTVLNGAGGEGKGKAKVKRELNEKVVVQRCRKVDGDLISDD